MKEQVITFKADNELSELLKNVPNKSEFIRHSILKALNNLCPLCNGTGIMKEHQKIHWEEFREHHPLRRCEDCKEMFLTCETHGGK
jgi:uncharacterized protein with PIN domain